MNCLFLTSDWPITRNAPAGASVLSYSHLMLLIESGVLVNFCVVPYIYPHMSMDELKETYPNNTNTQPKTNYQVHLIPIDPSDLQYTIIGRLKLILTDPVTYRYGRLVKEDRIKQLKQVIHNLDPDLIWAEDIIPATLAATATTDIPIVYSHYDWKWRIKSYRVREKNINIKKRFQFWLGRRHEEKVVRQIAGCVSGSVTEAKEIEALGGKHVGYFPTTYTPINQSNISPLRSKPRIVHLGGMTGTANRIGMERFMEVCWPIISDRIDPIPELWVIGRLEGSSENLTNTLQQARATCTGYVEDISSIMRPYDIHIVPWEYNTGTRTRIPLILNYAQALVSTKAAAACIQELQHNNNCILVDDLNEMAHRIIQLYSNDNTRKRLGDSGRDTFIKNFTISAQQQRFYDYIKNIISSNS